MSWRFCVNGLYINPIWGTNPYHPGMVYLPTFNIFMVNVGKYTIHGWYGQYTQHVEPTITGWWFQFCIFHPIWGRVPF